MSRAREGLPERYTRALDKLTEGRSAPLDERSALQAERLRERFGVSEAAHAVLLAELLGVSEATSESSPPPHLSVR